MSRRMSPARTWVTDLPNDQWTKHGPSLHSECTFRQLGIGSATTLRRSKFRFIHDRWYTRVNVWDWNVNPECVYRFRKLEGTVRTLDIRILQSDLLVQRRNHLYCIICIYAKSIICFLSRTVIELWRVLKSRPVKNVTSHVEMLASARNPIRTCEIVDFISIYLTRGLFYLIAILISDGTLIPV